MEAKDYSEIPPWDIFNKAGYDAYVEEFQQWCRLKMNRGHSIYGEKFQGDPVEHLLDELADAVNYLRYIRASLDEATALLRAVRENCDFDSGVLRNRVIRFCATADQHFIPEETI